MFIAEPSPIRDIDVLLKRRRPAFLLLDSDLRVECAEPAALELLAEAYGTGVTPTGEIPQALTASIRDHCANADPDEPLTVPVGGLVIHLRILRGNGAFYLISFERMAVRDHLKASTKRYGLTRREGQVLSLILHGMRASDIARELGISPMTVRDHFTNLLRKTGSRNRAEMLAKLMNS
jgi:DNA-binding CsgD family transcriptional regulator